MTPPAPIIGWARPTFLHHTYHAVLTIDPRGSVWTACRGRWSAQEPREYVEGRDRELDDAGMPLVKCDGCARAAREQRDAELAARGGAANLPVLVVSWPMTVSDDDLGGESG